MSAQLTELFNCTSTGRVNLLCAASPSLTGWQYLTYATLNLERNAQIVVETGGHEHAVLPLHGEISVSSGDESATVARADVFDYGASLIYAPPDRRMTITARTETRIAIGSAPAEVDYGFRVLRPGDFRVELRGGGAALRQVTHLLSPPDPAHRLILYEVHVPRGSWSGWPPHCHDGEDGSPYLEETYYFEHRPQNGFAIHRNFRESTNLSETFVATHGQLVTVPAGYHTTAASPGSHMYFLNFLAGELVGEARATPPCFDERYTWIDGRWDDHPLALPRPTLQTPTQISGPE